MDKLNETRIPRKRRRHSAEFKAQVLQEVSEPGNSIASVAQRHSLNANLVHKWLRTPPTPSNKKALAKLPPFVDVQPSIFTQANVSNVIVVDIPLGSNCPVKVHWPISQVEAFVHWLKAMMP